VAPVPAASPLPAAAAAPAAPAEGATPVGPPEKTAKPRHHHETADPGKVDPLHRKIDVPGESTPAELKNPFSTP
jgi:hypothetical protein